MLNVGVHFFHFLAFLTRVSGISQELGSGIALLTCIRSETVFGLSLLRSGVFIIFNSENCRSAPALEWGRHVNVRMKFGKNCKEGLSAPSFKLATHFQNFTTDSLTSKFASLIIKGRRLHSVFSVSRST